MQGVSKSTVCRVQRRVVSAKNEVMFLKVITWPVNSTEVAEEFFPKGGFLAVCGCVDGTLINLDLPHEQEQQY